MAKKRLHSKTHFRLAVLWAFLLIPTLLWWKHSILWIALISLYANFIGHWAAYEAARAEEHSEKGSP